MIFSGDEVTVITGFSLLHLGNIFASSVTTALIGILTSAPPKVSVTIKSSPLIFPLHIGVKEREN